MLISPVFQVEMVTMARRTRYFVLRGLYGLVLLVALFLVYVNSPASRAGTTDLGVAANLMAGFFTTFSFVQLVAVLMVGPAMVAGTIATERERRTIEYLFTAQLSNAEIVLSKLGARMLQISTLVLTGLPILALAMLMGGIAPEALFVVYAITGATVVTVAAISIAVSVWSKRARQAVSTAYVVLLALLVVPMVVYAIANEWNPTFYTSYLASVNGQLLAANPLWVLGVARFQASGTGTDVAWRMVLVLLRNQAILVAVAVCWASFAVRRVHLRQSGKAETRRRRFQLFRPTIGRRPMLWKELFAARTASRLGTVGRVAILLLVLSAIIPAVFGFVATLDNASGWRTRSYLGLLVTLTTALSCGMLLLLAARAAASITSEKERETWDSLLATPLESGEIVTGKLLGNLYSIRWGLLVVAFLIALGVPFKPSFLVGGVFMLVVFLVFAVWVSTVGILFSLCARSSIWAMGCTLGTCIFIGGGYLFCCVPMMMAGGGPGGEEIVFAPCIPFLLAFPGICSFESHGPGELTGPFVLGMLSYTITAAVLLFVSQDLVRRHAIRADTLRTPPTSPQSPGPLVKAECVDEADERE